MNVEIVVVFSVALFENLTFEECVAAKLMIVSPNSDEGEGFFLAKKIRVDPLNCLNNVITIISVSKVFVIFLICLNEWLHKYLEHIVCISFHEAKVSTGQ